MVTVVHELGERGTAAIRAACPDVDVVEVHSLTPPPELRAEVFFGGYAQSEQLLAWLDGCEIKWVQIAGTGVDRFPRELYGNGRVVTCARGAVAVPISEFVLASMLAFEKQIPDVWLHEAPERWNLATLGGLSGRTLGLVGLGGIGTAIVERAQAFGMRVVATRRHPDAPSPIEGVEIVVSLDDVLAQADHLVLAAPATARTKHMIGTDALSKVKPGVHLVNIARGSLVDQRALRVALDDGRVAAASLDTVDPEPLPDGHWLYTHPKVRLTPHISWSSPAYLGGATQIFLDNLGRYIAGEDVHFVVDPEEGY
jgi:phosphoglycerate dehydrogenase-like enzyme